MSRQPRSWLFVPADSEKKIAKALESEADALIFDLEDSVAVPNKALARDLLRNLPARSGGPQWWVRINPLRTEDHRLDLELLGSADIHGLVLPKAESGADITELAAPLRLDPHPRHRHRNRRLPVRPALLPRRQSLAPRRDELGRRRPLRRARRRLQQGPQGPLHRPLHPRPHPDPRRRRRGGVQPVDGVFADFRDEPGLIDEALDAARDGFTGKLAIHPAQVGPINAAFSPTPDQVAHARAIVAAFAAEPSAGVLSVDGRMVDKPHLTQAQRTLARAGD